MYCVMKEKMAYELATLLEFRRVLFLSRLLHKNNLNEILNLQKTVYEKLIDKSKLACLSEEEFHHILSGHGLMIGVYVDDVLIATRALLDPGNRSEERRVGKVTRDEW